PGLCDDTLHGPGHRRLDLVLHLHRLDDGHDLTRLEAVAGVDAHFDDDARERGADDPRGVGHAAGRTASAPSGAHRAEDEYASLHDYAQRAALAGHVRLARHAVVDDREQAWDARGGRV